LCGAIEVAMPTAIPLRAVGEQVRKTAGHDDRLFSNWPS